MPRRAGIAREKMALVEDMGEKLLGTGVEVKGKNEDFRPGDLVFIPLKYIRRHHDKNRINETG
jgi:hypothetical protein